MWGLVSNNNFTHENYLRFEPGRTPCCACLRGRGDSSCLPGTCPPGHCTCTRQQEGQFISWALRKTILSHKICHKCGRFTSDTCISLWFFNSFYLFFKLNYIYRQSRNSYICYPSKNMNIEDTVPVYI